MIFPFYIKNKQTILKNRVAHLSEQIKEHRISGVGESIREANNSYNSFALHTKNPFNKLKSFIPGTFAFSLRLDCARKIHDADKALSKAQIEIADNIKRRIDGIKDANRARPTCKIDPETCLLRNQYTTIFAKPSVVVAPAAQNEVPKKITTESRFSRFNPARLLTSRFSHN